LGEIVSVDPNSGYERWRLSVKETGAFVDDLGRPRKGEVASDILLWKDLVIFGVRGNHIMAVEGHSGRLHWNVTVDSLTPSNLTLDARGVLHLLTDSRYYRIHAQDGKMISEIDIEAALKEHGLLAICHIDVSTTHVFAGDLYGTLFALDQTNGKVAWKFFFGNRVPFGNYPLVADDRIYHLDGAGELRTF
jgi:outer membrane protein assembly factor BamB